MKIRHAIIMALLIGLGHAALAAPATLVQSVTYNSETITMRLTKATLRGANFELWAQNASGGYDVIVPVEERSYMGTVDEYPGAVSCGILLDSGEFRGAVYFDRGETWFTQGTGVFGSRALNYDTFSNFQIPTAPSVGAGQAGSTMIAFDVGIDADYDNYSVRGSGNISNTFEFLELGLSLTRAIYMRDTLLRPYLGRVIVRTSQSHDPANGLTGGTYLNAVRAEWNTNHTDADRDVVAGVTTWNVGGGLSFIGVIGTTSAYSVNDSYASGGFSVTWRHELGHNWGCSHYVGGSPEGTGLMGGNAPGRFSSCEVYVVLSHRDSKPVGILDDEGTYTATELPPYASMDIGEFTQTVTSSTTFDVLANDHDANGQAISLYSYYGASVRGGTVAQQGQNLVYTAPSGYAGTDHFLYTISDTSGKTATGVAVIDVMLPSTLYEAEDAVFSNYNLSTYNAGYTGTGYLVNNASGSSVEWAVNVATAGLYRLSFRHRSNPATAEISVNGQLINSAFAIPSSTSAYRYTGSQDAFLNAGNNTIRLAVPDYTQYLRLDHLRVTGSIQAPYITADAYVQGDSNSGSNYGGSSELWLKKDSNSSYDREVYLKAFYGDVADPISTATLRLIPTAVNGSSLNIRVRLLDDADDLWGENSITWSNRPTGVGAEVVVSGAGLTVGQPFDVDVTALLDQAQNINTIASFHIDVTSAASSDYVVFGSRENVSSNPELLIQSNSAPVWNTNPVVETGATEDAAYSSTLADDATDADSDPLTFSRVAGPAWLSVVANGTLSGTPGNADVGLNSWIMQVADGITAPVATTLKITVVAAPVNQAPAFTVDPFSKVNADEDVAYSASIAGDASDLESDSMTFSKVSGPSWLSVASDGTLSGTPGAGDVGLNAFMVQVDATGGSDTATLNITVVQGGFGVYEAEDAVLVNDTVSTFSTGYTGSGYVVMTAAGSYIEWMVNLPTAALSDLSFRHWTESANTMTLTVNGLVVDSNYTLSGTGAAWALSNVASVSLNAGSNTIRLTRDSGPNSVRVDHLLVAAMPANQAPAFTADPFSKANADEDVAYSASIAGDASDPESNSMTFSKVSGPAWLSVASDGTLSGTPSAGDVGANAFTVQVDATGGSDTTTLNITVDAATPSWTELTFDDFESGWGNWVDGGTDARIATEFALGSQCFAIQDNSSTSEVKLSNSLDLTGYSELKIEFSYVVQSFEDAEDFWVRLSSDGGSSWTTIKAYVNDVDFVDNGTRYNPVLTIDSGSYTFSDNVKIMFECDASGNRDDVFIDNVRISGQ